MVHSEEFTEKEQGALEEVREAGFIDANIEELSERSDGGEVYGLIEYDGIDHDLIPDDQSNRGGPRRRRRPTNHRKHQGAGARHQGCSLELETEATDLPLAMGHRRNESHHTTDLSLHMVLLKRRKDRLIRSQNQLTKNQHLLPHMRNQNHHIKNQMIMMNMDLHKHPYPLINSLLMMMMSMALPRPQ